MRRSARSRSPLWVLAAGDVGGVLAAALGRQNPPGRLNQQANAARDLRALAGGDGVQDSAKPLLGETLLTPGFLAAISCQ